MRADCKCCCHTDGGCHSAYIPQEWCCSLYVLRREHREPYASEKKQSAKPE